MLTDPLPRTFDVRKAANRQLTLSGWVNVENLPRIQALPLKACEPFDATIACLRDDENRVVLEVSIRGEVEVTCQRCLGAMRQPVETTSRLAAVWSDDEARHLPKSLEPLVTGEETDLWELVEEEFMLALPPFSYHDSEQCRRPEPASEPDEPEVAGQEQRENPFNVLAQLKGDREQTE